jgi:hypothetical protein
MIIIHAVQKLLNISRLRPALFISEPSAGQELHSWYAKLVSSTFKGKMLVMYVHQPSLLLVLTRGKSLPATVNEFYSRLDALLHRQNFAPPFIDREMLMTREGYIISKTNSKSMLGSMNAITENIEYRCSTYGSYDFIDLDSIENSFMHWLVFDKSKPDNFRRTSDYWKERGLMKL